MKANARVYLDNDNYVTEIETLRQIQEILGGYVEKTPHPTMPNILLLVDEDARLKGNTTPNKHFNHLVGTIVQIDAKDFKRLPY